MRENQYYTTQRFTLISDEVHSDGSGELLKMLLTLALASTCAPLRRRMRMMSVWFALAARCSGVSPRTVGTSGLALCCSR